jgi:hypothetical protein
VYCPECGVKYKKSISLCPKCGIPLISGPPPESGLQPSGFEEILATFNAGEIAIIKSLLDGEGITYYFKGEYFNYIEPLAQPAKLMVLKDDVEKAKEILKTL